MSTSSNYPEPGERFGPYRVERRLGVGGMGIVFEALEIGLNRRVALKVISPHLAADESFRTRFTNEAQSQASLDSPHVVQVFAHGEIDGALYIASQLIPDGDLGQMVRAQGAPPPRIAADIISQIAAGLADAHDNGLVHRDIKPGNVLLRIRGDEVTAYLTDFGIARQVNVDHSLTQAGFAIGTPSYMAPELHTGSQAGPGTDVYSLGCLLWSSLMGFAPYSGTTDFQLVSAHMSSPIPQLIETGPFEREINRILRTAMAKNAHERYATARQLRDDLRRVVQHLPAPTSVRPVGDAGGPVGVSPSSPTSPPPGVSTPSGGSPTSAGQFRPYGFTTPTPPPPKSKTGLIVGVVIGVVVLIAAATGIGIAVANSGGGGGGGGGNPTDPTTEPTSDEDIAKANLSQGLQTGEDPLEPADADCLADKMVDQHGIERLQEGGWLTEDLEYGGDEALDDDSELAGSFLGNAVVCGAEAGASSSAPS